MYTTRPRLYERLEQSTSSEAGIQLWVAEHLGEIVHFQPTVQGPQQQSGLIIRGVLVLDLPSRIGTKVETDIALQLFHVDGLVQVLQHIPYAQIAIDIETEKYRRMTARPPKLEYGIVLFVAEWQYLFRFADVEYADEPVVVAWVNKINIGGSINKLEQKL